MTTETLRVADVERDRGAIDAAVARLRSGDVVAIPTETVYGLAALPSVEAKLRATKERDSGKPFTWAVASREKAAELVDLTPIGLAKLSKRFWPGPLTLVAARRGGGGTLGVRVPGHAVALALLNSIGSPLLLTSANRSGEKDARDADEVRAAMNGAIPLILDAGPAQLGEASAVVSFVGSKPVVHRQGVIDRAMILRAAARQILLVCSGNTCRSPMAAALLKKLWAERLGVRPETLLDEGVAIASAGLGAMPGMRASEEAVDALASRRVDLSDHRSRPVTRELVLGADVVLAMTERHREALARGAPEAADRIALLDPDGRDVEDPMGSGPEVYRSTLEQIERALAKRVARWTSD